MKTARLLFWAIIFGSIAILAFLPGKKSNGVEKKTANGIVTVNSDTIQVYLGKSQLSTSLQFCLYQNAIRIDTLYSARDGNTVPVFKGVDVGKNSSVNAAYNQLIIPNYLKTYITQVDSNNSLVFLAQDLKYKQIDLISLNAKSISIRTEQPTSIWIDRCKIDDLIISGPHYLSPIAHYPNFNLYTEDYILHNSDKHVPSNISRKQVFEYIQVGELAISAKNNARLSHCKIGAHSTIFINKIDTVIFDSVLGDSINSHLTISTTPKLRSKILLESKESDFTNVDFDYSKFHLQYYPVPSYDDTNAWKSDIIAEYNSIIKSQSRQNNQQGIEDATKELAEFNDEQMAMGWLLRDIKLWWNDYGFDKSKVLWSSLQLFCVILIFNFFFFSKLLIVYDIAGIAASREYSYERKSKFWGPVNRFFLCILYSGFIFYGIKFDFSSLSVKKNRYVWLLLVEYVLGLVSVAFIANLIITK